MRRRMQLTTCLVVVSWVLNCTGYQVVSSNSAAPANRNSPAVSSTTTPKSTKPLRITTPVENDALGELPFVEGTVSDPNAKVWVIVHPMEVSDYWVQPPVTVKDGGKWKVQIHIGRPGAADIGKHFEIMAIANPTADLKSGDKLKAWPSAKWKSQVVEVVRK